MERIMPRCAFDGIKDTVESKVDWFYSVRVHVGISVWLGKVNNTYKMPNLHRIKLSHSINVKISFIEMKN